MKPTSKLFILTGLALGSLLLELTSSAAAGRPVIHHQQGLIKSVDAEKNSLVITSLKEKTEHRFLWNDQTQFTQAGSPPKAPAKKTTAAALKKGVHVSLTYLPGRKVPTLRQVQVLPKPASKRHVVSPAKPRHPKPAKDLKS